MDGTYLVRFDRSVFTYGGVQYQQLTNLTSPIGNWEFLSCTLESSDGPLLDIVTDPSLPHVKGFEQIAVRQYMDADSRYRMAGPPACAPVIRLNCTQPLCFLDGVTFESVSIGGCFDRPNAALQVIAGRVDSVLMLDSHKQGAVDVLSWGDNHSNHSTWLPVGRWTAKSLGGFTLVGAPQEQRCLDPYYGSHNAQGGRCFDDASLTGYSEKALLLGQSGERYARLSIDHDGSICHGDGTKAAWSACNHGHRVSKFSWDPPAIPGGGATARRVEMVGAATEDLVQVTHSMLGMHLAQISAHVASDGLVSVILRNAGTEPMDVEEGSLKVVLNVIDDGAPASRLKTDETLAKSTNFVTNPNFEETNSSGSVTAWRVPAVFSRSTDVVLPPATASLKYENADPKIYELVSQTVKGPIPGKVYDFSAAVKTVSLNASAGGGGATVCVQWRKGGEYSGGSFPRGPAGTTDGWVTVSNRFAFPSDADADSLSITVYVRGSNHGDATPTGVAYFDNVSLVVHELPPMTADLISPVYRGRVTADDEAPITARVRLRLETASSAVLVAKLKPKAGGAVVARKEVGPITTSDAEEVVDIKLDELDARSALAAGQYILTVHCVDVAKGNATIARSELNITRWDDSAPTPKVYIDEMKRTIVDGEPFFPMGMYTSTSMLTSSGLSNLSHTPFNMMMPCKRKDITESRI